MLWLYLLGTVASFSVALVWVLRRQKPLDDAIYAKKVAIEHVQSSVGWARRDGTFGSANQALASTLKIHAEELVGQEWLQIFPAGYRECAGEHYRRMLLHGMATFDGPGLRSDGSKAWLNIRLVAVYDHNMHFVGHHCLIEDHTHERELEERIQQFTGDSPVGRIYSVLNEESTSREVSTLG